MKIKAILFISIIYVLAFANDLVQPAQIAINDNYKTIRRGVRTLHREQDPPPEYSFILNGNGDPTTFLNYSYYDYMPFSNNGYNIRLQPETSMPYGYAAGGIYITYMLSETQNAGSERLAYYSYLSEYGTSYCSEPIDHNSTVREGFTSCAVDPYTADPFAVWHSVTEPDGSFDVNMSYFLYHAGAQHWRNPFIVIDNPEISLPYTGHPDDEFIWPQVHIGSSPIPDHQRVHTYANNISMNSAGSSNMNIIYLYADFDDSDLLATSDLDWTVQSFPYLDNLHYNEIARINKDMIVSEVDGKVVFFGNVADSLFALYSDDYGETFTKYTQQLKQELPNLINIHTGLPMFGDEDWFALPTNDLTHYNGIFTDENKKIQWMSGVNYNSLENINNGFYVAYYIYPKIFTFDTETGEFSFYDLDIQDTDPGDDHLAVAYDLNNDGEIDEYDENLVPVIPVSCPSWFFEGHWQFPYYFESNCKMTSNSNWIICVWHDGIKLQNAYFEEPGYDGWIEQPEIAIVISDDNGETWSDIRYINANPNDAIIDTTYHYDGNYAPEFEGMLPVNVTLGDKLEILSNEPGNYHAKLHFAFMDDEIYGSSSPNSGGDLRYAAIDLEFQEEWIDPVSVDPEIIPQIDFQLSNYPNPFNPSTTISFSISKEGNVELSIYNIKGQKIKQLAVEHISAGEHSYIWNGEDSNNKQVSSGIYFYKLAYGGFQQTNKMLLIK
jgi:hypothetical protein